jgi:hypothetical protein
MGAEIERHEGPFDLTLRRLMPRFHAWAICRSADCFSLRELGASAEAVVISPTDMGARQVEGEERRLA